MPKPNQTMLDRLAETFKSMGNKKPEIIQQTAWRDPLGYTLEQRRAITRNPERFQKLSMTPERRIYQRGIESIRDRNAMNAQNQLDDYQDDLESLQHEWNDAVDEAKESMLSDWRSGVEDFDFSEIDPYYLSVGKPSTNLGDYWDADMTPEEFYDAQERMKGNIDEYEDIVEHRESPEYIMELQRQSPRYRNYQRAMRQREENARLGRLNAAIMNLYRRGYSMPEIRAMLNGTIPTPAAGGR